MTRILMTTLLAAMLAGCSILGLDGLDDQRSQLERARARWERQRPAEYRYTLERSCFCGEETRGPVLIHVRGDSVLSRTYTKDGSAVPAQHAALFGTMEDLYDVIDHAIRRDAHRLGTEYDVTLGYLIRADIDYEENAVDEELSLYVSGFTIP